MDEKASRTTTGLNAAISAHQTETKTQWVKYHTKGGHGSAFEDACAMVDRAHGRTVDQCGRNNALNGADRIVNGQPIQSKCCATAARSFASGFDNSTGKYRYPGQKFEVPRDQYDEVVQRMRRAIMDGKVENVTDPNEATNIVSKGPFTTKECHRMAKAGNLESMKLDMRVQASACAFACGISGGMAFIIAKCNGETTWEALKKAAAAGGKSGAITMVGGVMAQQFLRTEAGRKCAAATTTHVFRPLVREVMKTGMGKAVVNKTASVIVGKGVTGAAAANVVSKTLRCNFVTSCAMAAASIVPDFIALKRGKISGAEFGENTACNITSIGGGWAGASSGAAIGTFLCPGIGTAIGGVAGGIAGGLGASCGTRKLFSLFKRK